MVAKGSAMSHMYMTLAHLVCYTHMLCERFVFERLGRWMLITAPSLNACSTCHILVVTFHCSVYILCSGHTHLARGNFHIPCSTSTIWHKFVWKPVYPTWLSTWIALYPIFALVCMVWALLHTGKLWRLKGQSPPPDSAWSSLLRKLCMPTRFLHIWGTRILCQSL